MSEERTEEFLVSILTNEPSEPMEIPKHNVRIVFKRPSITEKFRQRAWASKKLKEIGIDEDGEDPQTEFFFRYWGTLNSFVDKIYVPDETNGDFIIDGKKYTEYKFNKDKELSYKSLFEKYVFSSVYGMGMSEESFVSSVILVHAGWINDNTKVTADDIKNS